MATILVADDHEDAREMFGAILRRAGHTPLLVADGTQALAAYRRHRPDLVILDIFMPGKDGIDTLLELRQDFPEAKVIAISAGWHVPNLEVSGHVTEMDILDHARSVGANRAFEKPVDAATLLGAIDEMLRTPGTCRPTGLTG